MIKKYSKESLERQIFQITIANLANSDKTLIDSDIIELNDVKLSFDLFKHFFYDKTIFYPSIFLIEIFFPKFFCLNWLRFVGIHPREFNRGRVWVFSNGKFSFSDGNSSFIYFFRKYSIFWMKKLDFPTRK